MQKGFAILGICGFVLAGCAGNMAGENEGRSNQLHVNNHEPELYNSEAGNDDKRFGYVRHKRAGVFGAEQQEQRNYTINREQVADMISKLSAQVPNVDDVSTLVTDEEVLVIYRTDSDNRDETADQVKKTAISVVPRWFHVYVSDNTQLRQNVENFSTLNTQSRDIDTLVDDVIDEMRKSPQGRYTSEDENENGESEGDIMERMNTQQ
ncbi:YhcN/YlaJ family sporulation lipoprotein [Mesobacillus foraminis]|jgi:hypothetical protein|uniref:YhcN/YlaJ family sporulation lipoprotein n=1 Tax=Mesobacillus foraminis TaxID=279826 RepID=UPI000EF5511E|nr:YhcN/YlaJ family sporulation lipoprotein [Mesobacillus foraminis]MBT2758289.1 YhcN/YlaJ family sporulation lipoprotein [Mesobacillus foraminis]